MTRRRRRRSDAHASRLVQDAFDLFLDALANTLGVIMFIALMVVLFSAPAEAPTPEAPRAVTPDEAVRVAALLEQLARLEQELAELPPEGDPLLRERFDQLMRERAELRRTIARSLQMTAEASDALAEARAKTRDARTATRASTIARQEIEERIAALGSTSSFVRVSRFRDDPREPVLFLISRGAIERADPAPGEARILPGARNPTPLVDRQEAERTLERLLRGARPDHHRIEIAVWSDSFREYKMVEGLLVGRGFDLNPIPLEAGAALESGSGGIQ